MEGEAEALYLQLHKLSAITSEEGIDRILTTLWKTRKTGLQSTQKSSIQALLNLPSPTQLDPVLACLRSLIRKCARENFSADDLLKLFPPDLSLDLQSILILLLQKYQNQWKEEISRETSSYQNSLTRSTDSNHAKANLLPTFASFPSFVSTPMWLHQDDTVTNFNHNQLGVSTPVIVDSSVAPLGPMQFQRDAGPPTNLLQDYNKSPSGEIEVKFQLTRDILEAMLRSLTYIGEQLSNLAGTSSGPAQKKQKQ
ncbi:uncharacterized protein LOC123195394 isoform X3 [Mangifera indica]|uniref:uncharacterized protein LOC123195394 isoform X3 n=1 Tax=Mangifera indica TaxID=29780 RepID=UPI001CFB1FF6|nr:uncharacterized protein LOC123195394 isoform X3 [Mangifera indica]